ncbi:MAG: hypothetical protein ABIP50_02660 [Candidatus Saccharimonadales bacterium]
MYAGTTVGKKSGHIIGVHQRIDRIARRHITPLLPDTLNFPKIADVLYFEGNNGPDGIKRKSPSKDEPWHYIDPTKPQDRALIDMILDHQVNLATALKKKNYERASFETAWMAHAIVDGLTPAHHFPLADKIEELFGMPHTERQTIREKNVIKGDNRRDTLSKNWKYWGKHGIFINHIMFEFGVASVILGQSFRNKIVHDEDIALLEAKGYETVFRDILKSVMSLRTYERYTNKGWDRQLGKDVQKELVPLIVKGVVLGWYAAVLDMRKK